VRRTPRKRPGHASRALDDRGDGSDHRDTAACQAGCGEHAARPGSRRQWILGYDRHSSSRTGNERTFGPDDIVRRPFVVADLGGLVAGCSSVDGDPPVGELGNRWIRPSKIGTGLGRVLWQRAMATHGRPGASGSCVSDLARPIRCWSPLPRGAHRGCPRVTDKTLGKLLSPAGARPGSRPPRTNSRRWRMPGACASTASICATRRSAGTTGSQHLSPRGSVDLQRVRCPDGADTRRGALGPQ
jgi:hypothetical protein